ncbi:MAG: acetolactate synthase large subunit [Candidatus Methylomirabilota bacterium]
MTGAQSLLQTLVNGGVKICFANPGTSEMHFIAAADRVPGMRTVLGLFEGVCTGAADGYARMAGTPAATLLHLGPGLGNGFANLHNARRAPSPMVNIVGDHATYHLRHDPPLATDIEAIVRGLSGWVRRSRSAADVPRDAAETLAAALTPPGQVATLILPADCSWSESREPAPAPVVPAPAPVDPAAIRRVADLLRGREPVMLLLGGPLLMEDGLRLAGRIARATGARILGHRVTSRIQRGAGRVVLERLPYPVEPAIEMLRGAAHLVLAGASLPVPFFAWQGKPSWIIPDSCRVHALAAPGEDCRGALEALAEMLGAGPEVSAVAPQARPPLPGGALTAETAWRALAALMPEGAIVSDEGVSSSRAADGWTAGAPPHDWLNVTGGSIGQGLPVATGAALACPGRKVFAMESDGAGMYTLQALWTQARERLDVVTVIFANRAYQILQGEYRQAGLGEAGPKAAAMLEIGHPDLDWVKLAEGMGVPGSRAETAEAFADQLRDAIRQPGPRLIEAVL